MVTVLPLHRTWIIGEVFPRKEVVVREEPIREEDLTRDAVYLIESRLQSTPSGRTTGQDVQDGIEVPMINGGGTTIS